ncbi:MAG: thiamine pyrophosphate-binding protein [Acidimicrobiaceae bacterium]|nr:thiamine pyrophosphate-binding protein [Acidimicrobiaceae bacterium]
MPAEPGSAADPVYDTVAFFAAGLVEHGVTDVVISPGSRSTALALTLHAQPRLRTWIQLDERSAGFFALGQARCTGRPSVLVCTSGTAAANYLPAIIEAHHAGVPMIVCTADRPPELRGWGSAQTIDQVKIYGATTRWAADLAVAGDLTPTQGRMIAHRAAASATGVDPGPVHLNWPLREPLEPLGVVPVVDAPNPDAPVAPGETERPVPAAPAAPVEIERPVPAAPAAPGESERPVPAAPAAPGDSTAPGETASPVPAAPAAPGDSSAPGETASPISAAPAAPGESSALADLKPYERGVVIVGPDAAAGIEAQNEVVAAALDLGAATAWPVVGEPISGTRRARGGSAATVIAHADHLLRHADIGEELRPDVVVRVGGTPTTKPLRLWLEAHRPTHVVLIDPANRWNDPSCVVTRHLVAGPVTVLTESAGAVRRESVWCERWKELDRIAGRAISDEINRGPLLSALATSVLAEAVPAGTLVMASNSMPVRELDSFVPAEGPRIEFVGNRGAGGIDGITSTALGLASQHEGPVVLFIGDIALLHDLGALFGAARCGLHLTVVCVNNNGGGIFSSLPIASRGEEFDFETLFRTPHGLDLAGFDGVGGVRIKRINEVTSASDFAEALGSACESDTPGVDVVLVSVDPDADLAQHRAIATAVKDAVS